MEDERMMSVRIKRTHPSSRKTKNKNKNFFNQQLNLSIKQYDTKIWQHSSSFLKTFNVIFAFVM